MKNTTVQINYPAEKLEAIRQYTGRKEVDMTADLQDALTRMYVKYVPKDVREFLEARESAQAATPRRPRDSTRHEAAPAGGPAPYVPAPLTREAGGFADNSEKRYQEEQGK